MTLKAVGAALSVMLVGLIVVDLLSADPLLDDVNKIIGSFALPFLALVVLGGAGDLASRGVTRYSPSGRKMSGSEEKLTAPLGLATDIHARLISGDS